MVITKQRLSCRFPSFFGYIPLFANLKATQRFMGTTQLGLQPGKLTHGWRNKEEGDNWLAQQYQRHNQHVQDNVPESQLLVSNVKQGWEPLCTFLDKDVPDEPFQHCQVNDAKSLVQLQNTFLRMVYGWIPALVVTIGAATMYVGKGGSILVPGSFRGVPKTRGEL
jgi:hypothetical protein